MAQGVMHGDPVSPTTINIVVDTVANQSLSGVCNLEVTHHGIGCKVVDQDITFYAYYRSIMGVEIGWVKESFGAMVALSGKIRVQNHSYKLKP